MTTYDVPPETSIAVSRKYGPALQSMEEKLSVVIPDPTSIFINPYALDVGLNVSEYTDAPPILPC